jgi:hypothetical protein
MIPFFGKGPIQQANNGSGTRTPSLLAQFSKMAAINVCALSISP